MNQHQEDTQKAQESLIQVIKEMEVFCAWWTPDTGDLICSLCGKCPGWRSEEKPLDCVSGNPYCG